MTRARRKMRQRNAALKQAEERLERARQGIIARDNQIRALKTRIAALERKSAEDQAALLSSTSWRITAPLRLVSALLRRLRGQRRSGR